MDRINDVDLLETFNEICQWTTLFHRRENLDNSIEQMDRMLRLNDPVDRTLIWINSTSGIECYPEYKIFQKDTDGYNRVQYHAKHMKHSKRAVYAVEPTGWRKENGVGKSKVYGNLYEIDLPKYAEYIEKKAVKLDYVTIFYNLNNWLDNMKMPYEEFSRRYPDDLPRFPIEYWREEPGDTDAQSVFRRSLEYVKNDRQANCNLREAWRYTSDIREERLDLYAKQIIGCLNSLREPNSPDKQFFSTHLNYIVPIALAPINAYDLMQKLPYENAEFSIKKGQYEMCVVVPRDEVLRERQEQREEIGKPSIITQLQNKGKDLREVKETGITASKRGVGLEV